MIFYKINEFKEINSRDFLKEIKANLNEMTILFLQECSLKNKDDGLMKLKLQSTSLMTQIKEIFKKENQILNENKSNFFKILNNELSFSKNLHVLYFSISHQEKNKLDLDSLEFVNMFLAPEEIMMIIKKRYEYLEDFPALTENELNEKNNLNKITNAFSEKFLKI